MRGAVLILVLTQPAAADRVGNFEGIVGVGCCVPGAEQNGAWLTSFIRGTAAVLATPRRGGRRRCAVTARKHPRFCNIKDPSL